jgi:hypothetical protein
MRRMLAVSLVLMITTRGPAFAQSCQGLASFSSGPLQVSGEGAVALSESSGIRGGLAYGLSRGPFARVRLGTLVNQTTGGSSLDLGVGLGYEIQLGGSRGLHVCPVASVGWEIGPNDGFGSGVDRSRRSAQLGLALATSIGAPRLWEIVPSLGVAYAYQKDQAQDNVGALLFQISDRYALAQLGLGLIFRSRFSVRPYLDLPLALDGGDPSFGLTLGYNFGGSRVASRH